MKTILKYTGLLCLLLGMASCNEEQEYYTLEVPADQMFLTASSTDIVLTKPQEAETAVTFTWNEATNRGEGTSITYLFRMWMVEQTTNVSETFEIPAGERSISFTHLQLNDILAEWNITPGDVTTIEAEVIAQVNCETQYMKPELSTTRLDVTGYAKNLEALYLTMTDEAGAVSTMRMAEVRTGTGIYRTTIENLAPCSYFFATSSEESYPAYVRGEDDNTLAYAVDESAASPFENTLTGAYDIIVDLNALTVRVIPKIYDLPADGMWLVGDAVPSIGYDMPTAYANGAFTNDDLAYPEIWKFTGEFSSSNGEHSFKIFATASGGWNDVCFFAPFNGADPMEEHTFLPARSQGDGGDLKWFSNVDGMYTVVIDLSQMTINMVPAE